MKKTTKFALTGLAAGIAFAAFTTTAQAQEEWTMTSTWPENLDLIKIDQHWVELVNKLAGEELQINFRAGGTLMPGTEVFDATETGSIEAAGHVVVSRRDRCSRSRSSGVRGTENNDGRAPGQDGSRSGS